ncbi:coiled-coil domain-containing protein 137-like [Ornithodoros turicata]|uniref:Putative coiled-coil domain-containing protein n=1 Tax=Ornithodoros turicata TaxID=34597 RepID=A0A2R5LII5_9ACAR
MGRRIPKSTRHKKLKSVDPLFKGTVKEDRRANRPPKSLEQEVPRSFTELFGPKQNAVKVALRKKRKPNNQIEVRQCKKEVEQPGMTRPLKPLPDVVQQQRYETDRQFIQRINSFATKAFGEAAIEQKFDVDIRHDSTGKVVVNAQGSDPDYGSRKREKRRAREKRLREKKRKIPTPSEFAHLKDGVAFGEVVHEPPQFSGAHKEQKTQKELLLKKLLETPASRDLTVKRKMLQPGDRRLLEAERQRVISAYRQTKKKSLK